MGVLELARVDGFDREGTCVQRSVTVSTFVLRVLLEGFLEGERVVGGVTNRGRGASTSGEIVSLDCRTGVSVSEANEGRLSPSHVVGEIVVGMRETRPPSGTLLSGAAGPVTGIEGALEKVFSG